MSKKVSIEAIDQLLPQTQCGLCDYAGCKPYAKAMVEENATINLCPPGGVETLIELGTLLEINPEPYLKEVAEKSKPEMVAIIREDECIGCTKCIQACPTDAIFGSGKKMHTVILDDCTGCELCIEPCPVDCIDMVEITPRTMSEKKQKANQWRTLYQQREARQQRLELLKSQKHQQSKQIGPKSQSISQRKAAIEAAIARVKQKKRALT